MITTRSELWCRVAILNEVADALKNRRTLRWGEGQRMTYTRLLAGVGIELVTATGAKKRGLVIKQRQKPVANGYYGAPLQRYADLYIVGIQTKPKPRSQEAP